MNREELIILQNNILVDSVNMNKNHHLLYCTWCEEQRNMTISDKMKLGKHLKGNRRHVCFFCKEERIKKFRDGMDDEIEMTCRYFLKLFNLCGSPTTSLSVLYKVQELLLDLQRSNIGRLRPPVTPIKNYLPIKEWCIFFDIEEKDINHKLLDINILSHILGFGSALGDGELADNCLGVVDCIHTGAIPSSYEDLMLNEICNATTKWRKDDVNICLKDKMLQMWKDIKELVRMKFKGIHKICSVVSKDKEDTFKKSYKLSRKDLISTRDDLKSKKRKFSDIDGDDDELTSKKCNKTKGKQQLQLSEIWSKPKKCLGMTCGNEMNFWNCFTTFKPNWISLGIHKCDRCGRYVSAMKKAHAALVGLKDLIQNLEIKQKSMLLDLIHDSQKNMINLYNLYSCINTRKNAHKSNKKKQTGNANKPKISENDRLALLIFGRALGCKYNTNFGERRLKIAEFTGLMEKNPIASSNCNFCFTCSDLFRQEKEKIIIETFDNKSGIQRYSFICHKCFIHGACTLATSEIKSCLDNDPLYPSKKRDNSGSRTNKLEKSRKKIDSDICTAIGLDSLNAKSRRDINALVTSKGQPISSISMQIIITDIKRWICRKGIFIAKADCSNLLYNSVDITWKDWVSKFKTNMDDKRIPEGWFFFPICCGNIKQAIWHLLIIHKWKGVVRGWSFEFTKTKSRNTSPAMKHLSSLFSRRTKMEWKTCKKCQIMDTDSGVVVAVKIASCIWALTNMGDINQLLNKFSLMNFDEDPDLSITSARNFLSRIQGKYCEIAEYLEKITGCGRKRKRQD